MSEGRGDPGIIHGAFFVTLCSVHAAHVVGGIAALVCAWRRPRLLGVCATFWHFVGIVWVYLYAMLSVF